MTLKGSYSIACHLKKLFRISCNESLRKTVLETKNRDLRPSSEPCLCLFFKRLFSVIFWLLISELEDDNPQNKVWQGFFRFKKSHDLGVTSYLISTFVLRLSRQENGVRNPSSSLWFIFGTSRSAYKESGSLLVKDRCIRKEKGPADFCDPRKRWTPSDIYEMANLL